MNSACSIYTKYLNFATASFRKCWVDSLATPVAIITLWSVYYQGCCIARERFHTSCKALGHTLGTSFYIKKREGERETDRQIEQHLNLVQCCVQSCLFRADVLCHKQVTALSLINSGSISGLLYIRGTINVVNEHCSDWKIWDQAISLNYRDNNKIQKTV